MYGNESQGAGQAAAGALGNINRPQADRKPTALDELTARFIASREHLHAAAQRIEAVAGRMMPTPTGVASADKQPAPSGSLHRLEMVAQDFDGLGKWLHDIAERLERIA